MDRNADGSYPEGQIQMKDLICTSCSDVYHEVGDFQKRFKARKNTQKLGHQEKIQRYLSCGYKAMYEAGVSIQ